MKPITTPPLISVILPVYNAEKYVVESVQSVLDQSYPNIEIICCDDGSTDRSFEIVKAFEQDHGGRITVVETEKNSGISAARNRAIQAAQGEYLAFIDADDIWKPGKLSTQMEQFANDPDLDISFAWMQCFISPELPEEIRQLRYCPPEPFAGYIPGTALVRKDSFDRVGLFNPEWRLGEFIDWYARAQDLGLKSSMIEPVFLLRRIHETNTGVTERPSRTDYVKVIRAALERKRNAKK